MSLPLPTFTFTIPSIHDDIILDCRLYLPWQKLLFEHRNMLRAAIIAHPYAPLGGSFDDPIVDAVAGALLKAGYVTCTFNFRGASGSAGRTSWSAKPELADYISAYGFLLLYLSCLGRGYHRCVAALQAQSTTVSLEAGGGEGLSAFPVRLILAGYSYGSLIVSHLPDAKSVVEIFEHNAEGSAVSEIRLRASHLSTQTLKELEARLEHHSAHASLQAPAPQLSRSASSVRIGGFESEATAHRVEQESRKRLDVRRSLDRVHEKIHPKIHRSPIISGELDEDPQANIDSAYMMQAQVCYLLISPLLPPLATLATAFSNLYFRGISKKDMPPDSKTGVNLVEHPSLAVYGDKDSFTSIQKLAAWARDLAQKPGSCFQYHAVDNAGHFWREPGVWEQLRTHIMAWESSL